MNGQAIDATGHPLKTSDYAWLLHGLIIIGTLIIYKLIQHFVVFGFCLKMSNNFVISTNISYAKISGPKHNSHRCDKNVL